MTEIRAQDGLLYLSVSCTYALITVFNSFIIFLQLTFSSFIFYVKQNDSAKKYFFILATDAKAHYILNIFQPAKQNFLHQTINFKNIGYKNTVNINS